MAKMRNLVVGCDGTWNKPGKLGSHDPAGTNVVKFLNALASDGGGQERFYEKGVGTRAFERLPGGIYGKGLDKRILGCYRFLQKRFADKNWKREQNRIFLLGFSRGAYTARRISGLLAHSGIPAKSRDCDLGWQVYRKKDEESAQKLKRDGRFFDAPVEMVGVWDTVKATNDDDYHDTRLAGNIAAGYHAISIDEKRKFFPVLRWDADPRALEVWFAGVHSDVGGGYPECGLSDVALRWMIDRAMQHGLLFKKAYVKKNFMPDSICDAHESYDRVEASISGVFYRNFGRKRSIANRRLNKLPTLTKRQPVSISSVVNGPKTPE